MIIFEKRAKGFEPSTSSLGSCNHIFVTDCNNSNLCPTDFSIAALGASHMLQIEQFPSDLQVIIRKWGSLSEALRKAIMVIMETSVSQARQIKPNKRNHSIKNVRWS
jgi:hypothetical protein